MLVISPHLDDAALSCAGAITRLVARGQGVTVVTVCTADDDPASVPSPLARRSHAAWGLGRSPFGPRCEEDAEAMRMLGARAVHLGMHDAVYRRDEAGRPLYRKPVRVPIHPHDVGEFLPALREALRDAVDGHPKTLVLCPLGTGGHVDHLLVRAAAEDLADVEDLVYYEEYPYLTSGTADPSAGHVLEREPALLSLTREEFDTRVEAIACYRSQLRGLFPTHMERVREILAARVPLVGPLVNSADRTPAAARVRSRLGRDLAQCEGERYWCLPDSPFRHLLVEPAGAAADEA